MNKPAILLADEPTGNLDPALSADIMQLFQDLNSVGVIHRDARYRSVEQMQRRVLTLDQGRMVSEAMTGVVY